MRVDAADFCYGKEILQLIGGTIQFLGGGNSNIFYFHPDP